MKITKTILWTLISFAAALSIGCSQSNGSNEIVNRDGFAPVAAHGEFDSIIVKCGNNSSSCSPGKSSIGNYQVLKSESISAGTFMLVDAENKTKTETVSLLTELRTNPDIEYVEPNYNLSALGWVPNDSYFSYQWHLNHVLDMPGAWELEQGTSTTVVAVIDTGAAYDLEDLKETSFDLVNDYDFVNDDDDAYDDNSHGTHCAGTIAQSTNNSTGVAGMAPGVTILPLKVLSSEGYGDSYSIAQAIRYAADNGAHIISMSLGGGGWSRTMYEACQYAYENGVTIFAASGNDNSGTVGYPAAYDEYVIAVGSVDYASKRAPYSNYGSSLDIMAPGGDTTADLNSDGYGDGVLQQTIKGYDTSTGTIDYTPVYAFFQGTSMACPHAAGLAALLKSHNALATPDTIRAALQNSATDLGSSNWDTEYGYGLINPVAALNYIKAGGGSSDDEKPVIITFSGPAETSNRTIEITLTGTDNIGITGWYLKENSSQAPSASSSGWSASKPSSFDLSSEGDLTVYAWARDAAGNISASKSIEVTYTQLNSSVPVITEFSGPTNTTSAVIPVTFTTSPTVTWYWIREWDSATNEVYDTGWINASLPASYTLQTGEGTKTIAAWVWNDNGMSTDKSFVVQYDSSGSSGPVESTVRGTLYGIGDYNTWKINSGGDAITIQLSFTDFYYQRWPFVYVDMDLYLYNPGGELVAYSEGYTGLETINYRTRGVDGTYEVEVYLYNTNDSTEAYPYVLKAQWEAAD
ncbi:MAG: peptidase S8 [bacterium]|nr:peptidase S8 [bacterium]